jgi:hypothetical protein
MFTFVTKGEKMEKAQKLEAKGTETNVTWKFFVTSK